MTKSKWYDPGSEYPWLLPIPESTNPDNQPKPEANQSVRVQLTILDALAYL